MKRLLLKQLTILIFLFIGSTEIIAQQDAYIAGQLYVRLRDQYAFNNTLKPAESIMDVFRPFRERFNIRKVEASFYFSESEALRRTFRVYFDDPEKKLALIRALEDDEAIEYAEKIPQDSFFFTPDDIGANSNTGTGQWYLYKVRALQAWDLQRGISSIKVAVVDDAVQIDHPDLAGVCLQGRDVAEDDPSPAPPDTNYSHGTHVSGIIAAKTNNSEGIASLAHGVSIIPIKITLNGQPQTPTAGYEGVAWAITQGADIINISWGSENVSYTAQTVIGNAINAGITVVAASGNSGNSSINFPAGYPGVISVASTTNVDVKAGSSNFGTWIDIAAPGDKMRSTIPMNNYGFKSGTSFAAPMVCALAALILSKDSTLTPLDIENCIKASADNIDVFNPDYIGQLGAGRINAEKAIACASARSASCELGILKAESPSPASCSNSFIPSIRIQNFGTDTIFSFNLNYQLDSEFPKMFVFEDTLAPGKDTLIRLTEIQAAIGSHTLKFTIQSGLNGACTDAYPGNNVLSYPFSVLNSLGQVLPFTDDFESNTFQTKNWFVENPGSDFGWEITTTGGLTPGNKSARLTYYLDTKVGERDYLTTPSLNFSGYSAISLTVKHAYTTRGGAAPSDSLIISISTDCGATWKRLKTFVETGTKTFSTRVTQGVFFSPTLAKDWCGATGWAACTTVNLTPFKGNVGVRIRFEGYNKNGNNIYIDNVSITGTLANLKPAANFSAAGNEEICEGQTVQFTNLSRNQPNTVKWLFEGGVPDSSDIQDPIITYPQTGNYNVRLVAQNNAGVDTMLRESYIYVKPAPNISVIADPDSICKGKSSKLRATGGGIYSWSPQAGLTELDKDTASVNPNITTNYTVQVLTDSGCTNSGSVSVYVYPAPLQPKITNDLDSCLLDAPSGTAYEWYYNGVQIENAGSGQLQVTKAGNYNVRVYNENGCGAFSSPFKSNCTSTSIPDLPVFSLRPNPVEDFFLLEGLAKPVLISLYSISGQEIIPATMVNPNQPVQLSRALSGGLYLLKIMQDSRIYHLKLVLSH